MYTVLGLLKFLPFSAAQWAAPRLHESYLSHHESSVELLLAEHFNQQQQEVPETGQQSSYLTAGVLSSEAIDNGRETCFHKCAKTWGNINNGLRCVGNQATEQKRRIRKDTMILNLSNEL